jgi:carbonic anhydrase
MSSLKHLIERNRAWAAELRARNPDFFSALAEQQQPRYLWIGCSDSRVPANEITGLAPGELFVHRNVANVVVHSDLNCLSVLQFAVEALRVEHVMVVGHYGCGGVHAAFDGKPLGLIDNWLRHVQDVAGRHADLMARRAGDQARKDLLCELNVIEQVVHVARTTIVQDAWRRGQPLTLHAWIYSLHDGLVSDLGLEADSPQALAELYPLAISALGNARQDG